VFRPNIYLLLVRFIGKCAKMVQLLKANVVDTQTLISDFDLLREESHKLTTLIRDAFMKGCK